MRSPIFPVVGSHVDGLTVGDHIPNTESIAATLVDYTVWAGVREVPLDAFEVTDPRELFYAADDLRRCHNLADAIAASGRIDPLIVVLDADGLLRPRRRPPPGCAALALAPRPTGARRGRRQRRNRLPAVIYPVGPAAASSIIESQGTRRSGFSFHRLPAMNLGNVAGVV